MDKEEVIEQYKRTLEADYRYSISKFDDQALFISSGSLAVSLTFLKDIVPLESSRYMVLYFSAVSVFAILILMSFLSHYLSSKLIDQRLANIENGVFEVPEDKIIPLFNIFTIIFLTIGMACLLLFCILNLYEFKQGLPSDISQITQKL